MNSKIAEEKWLLYQFKEVLFPQRWDLFSRICSTNKKHQDGWKNNWNCEKLAKTKNKIRNLGFFDFINFY